MRRFFYPIVIALATLTFIACGGTEDPPVDNTKVTGVTLNHNTYAIETGEELTLVPTVAPETAKEKGVTWESSNRAIATVDDNGVVKGIAVGEATITVKTVDGNFTDECVITVAQGVVKVTGVTLDITEKTIAKDGTFTLKATVEPAEATNQAVKWNFDNTKVSVADDPNDATQKIVTGLAGGVATITVETEEEDSEGNPFTAQCEVTVTVPLESIAVDPTPATVSVGGTAIVRVVFTPEGATDRDFTFTFGKGTDDQGNQYDIASGVRSTDNPDEIIVTGLAAASASLTVTSTVKDANNNTITAMGIVQVRQPATGLTIEQATLDLRVTETRQLTPVFTPANTTVKTLTWTSSAPETVSVSDAGVVTGVALGGPVTITAATTDGSNLTATCQVTVVEGVAHPFGMISFRSAQTWNMPSTLIWSDYVTATRCKKDNINTSNTTPAEPADIGGTYGDCMQNVDGDNVYADLFSFNAVDKWEMFLCPAEDGWRAPTEADFQALDAYFYPSASMTNKSHPESDKYFTEWGAEAGGYWDNSYMAINNRDTYGRIWTGEHYYTINQMTGEKTVRSDRIYYIDLVAGASPATELGFRYVNQANSFALGLRCVKDAN